MHARDLADGPQPRVLAAEPTNPASGAGDRIRCLHEPCRGVAGVRQRVRKGQGAGLACAQLRTDSAARSSTLASHCRAGRGRHGAGCFTAAPSQDTPCACQSPALGASSEPAAECAPCASREPAGGPVRRGQRDEDGSSRAHQCSARPCLGLAIATAGRRQGAGGATTALQPAATCPPRRRLEGGRDPPDGCSPAALLTGCRATALRPSGAPASDQGCYGHGM